MKHTQTKLASFLPRKSVRVRQRSNSSSSNNVWKHRRENLRRGLRLLSAQEAIRVDPKGEKGHVPLPPVPSNSPEAGERRRACRGPSPAAAAGCPERTGSSHSYHWKGTGLEIVPERRNSWGAGTKPGGVAPAAGQQRHERWSERKRSLLSRII